MALFHIKLIFKQRYRTLNSSSKSVNKIKPKRKKTLLNRTKTAKSKHYRKILHTVANFTPLADSVYNNNYNNNAILLNADEREREKIRTFLDNINQILIYF